MLTLDAVQPTIHKRRHWLNRIIFIVGGLLFVMPYVLRVVFMILQPAYILESPNILYAVLGLFSFLQIAFSTLWLYLLSSLLVVGLSLAGLRWGHPSQATRLLLILMLLATIFFPWFYHYEPAVVAAPGYGMRWPTQPDLLNGVVKRVQMGLEQRPCVYTLLGWSSDGTLYYQSACDNVNVQVWAYSPYKQTNAQQIETTPSDLTVNIRSHSQVLTQVRSPSVYPPEGEPVTRSVEVRDNGMTSPDGHWVALVARHIYGPEDVLIVMSK